MGQVASRRNKAAAELLREAACFAAHALLALLVLGGILLLFAWEDVSPVAREPKMLCTVLAILLPLLAGFTVMLIWRDTTACSVWISALLVLLTAAVHVLDLPTGAGMCDGCGPADKLWRTLFSISRNSGILEGNGVLVGTWVPLAMLSYAMGAKLAALRQCGEVRVVTGPSPVPPHDSSAGAATGPVPAATYADAGANTP